MAALLSSVFVGGMHSPANALSIRVSQDGDGSFDCTDNGGCDQTSTTGAVVFIPSIGVFTTTIGIGSPITGSKTVPDLDLTASLVGTGIFHVLLTDTDFVGPLSSGLQPFDFHVGGTTKGTLSLTAYLDDGNVPFAKTSLIALLGPFVASGGVDSTISFDQTKLGSVNASVPYSLTIEAILTHVNAQDNTSFNAEVETPIPEPSSLLLLGSGLIILDWLRRKQKNS